MGEGIIAGEGQGGLGGQEGGDASHSAQRRVSGGRVPVCSRRASPSASSRSVLITFPIIHLVFIARVRSGTPLVLHPHLPP